jgi:signal transduction histidine kinase
MKNALRSLWAEPRAENNPGILWWDRWLVAVLIAGALLEGFLRDDVAGRPLAIAWAVILAFTLLWRRTHPLVVTAIAFSSILVFNLVTLLRSDPSIGLYISVFVLLIPYSLLRWGSGREIVIGLALIVAGFATGIAADVADWGEAIAAFVFAMSPVLIGATVRYRAHARSRDRDQAVLKEREQLARELHDTVAHHVSAIAIQAQAGRTLAANDPGAPLAALHVIEEEASRTLAEMRAMVGALREGDEPELTPLPGIADIVRLARGVGEAPAVKVELAGSLDDMAPAVNAALYRLAQESITNAIRHARKATAIEVVVQGEGRDVRLTVRDDGDTVRGGSPEPGFGLLGMTERAKLLGGRLEAGPSTDGGWTVTAVLPKSGIER